MAFVTSGAAQFNAADIPGSVGALYNYVAQLRQELDYFSQNLDSMNVTSLNTNETNIKSADGSTHINGNLLEQTDTKRTRLVMGYDPVLKIFKFEMYDTSKNKNVYLDSTGQFRLAGRPMLEMYDNQVPKVKRLALGYDPVNDKFIFSLRDPLGVETIYLDDAGEAVYAGNVKTEKNVFVGNNIYVGDALSKDNKGIWFFDAEGTIGQNVGMFLNEYAPDNFELRIDNLYDRISLKSDYQVFCTDMAEGVGLMIDSMGKYFTLANLYSDSDTPSSILQGGSADLVIQHQGSGNIWIGNFSGKTIFEYNPYVESVTEDSKLLTKAEVQALINSTTAQILLSYATQAWVTANFVHI
jgi:hypothetical protein